MLSVYPIIYVSEGVDREDEQVGSKAKFWFKYGSGRAMFKVGTPGTGDPWGEKVAEQIALHVGLPAATVDLAVCAANDLANERGIVSPSFLANSGDELVLGNEMLFQSDASYPIAGAGKLSAHTVAAVCDALEHNKVHPPTSWNGPACTGAEVFVGYLILDAAIGNSDRHHQNWGVIRAHKGLLRLAPTFDHATSLGTKLRDDERQARLDTRDLGYSVRAYAARCTSALYRVPEDKKPLKTHDVIAILKDRYPDATRMWLNRFRELDDASMNALLARIPAEWASEAERRFAAAVVRQNLLQLHGSEVA